MYGTRTATPKQGEINIPFVYGLSYRYHMSGENLVKFLLGTLDRVCERALGLLGS